MKENLSKRPFIVGAAVPPDMFVGRKREIMRLVRRVVNGQSVAVYGEPRCGKTSMLDYITSPNLKHKLFGEYGKRLLFSYVDAQTLDVRADHRYFWEYVLKPLYDRVVRLYKGSRVANAYSQCQKHQFDYITLERLIAELYSANLHYAVVVDEFDALIEHRALNSSGFFGSLRGLVTRGRGAICLVIASRTRVSKLNSMTQENSRFGSPYFNYFTEFTMGPFSEPERDELVSKCRERFNHTDIQYIYRIGGTHPYLLQAAAQSLWDSYEEGETDSNTRRVFAGESCLDEVATTLDVIWDCWSNAERRVYMTVGISQISEMAIGDRRFKMSELINDLRDHGPEIRELRRRGFIERDRLTASGWRIGSELMLWWLSERLVRMLRDRTDLEEWLQSHEKRGPAGLGNIEKIREAVDKIGNTLEKGVITLIEAAAKGAGEALIKGSL
jgi:hypothetical protein